MKAGEEAEAIAKSAQQMNVKRLTDKNAYKCLLKSALSAQNPYRHRMSLLGNLALFCALLDFATALRDKGGGEVQQNGEGRGRKSG
jgi:hypothetical protein